jgi:hypothetical protein
LFGSLRLLRAGHFSADTRARDCGIVVRMARKPNTNGNGEAPKPLGRPSSYSPEMAAKICAEMAQGKSLRSIVEQPDMPDRMTVVGWLAAHEDFRAQYTVAREIGLDHFAELTLAEAEADIPPEKVQAAKLKWDARRWHLSKMLPKRYGDKLTQEHQIDAAVGIQAASLVAAVKLTPPEIEEGIRALLIENAECMGVSLPPGASNAERLGAIMNSGQPPTPEMFRIMRGNVNDE